MNLHDAVAKIQGTNWTYNNNFDIQFLFDDKNKIVKSEECRKLKELGQNMSLYIKSFQVPQIGTSNVIDKFILDRPRIAMGMWESTSFDLDFYDFDCMNLYKMFVSYVSKERYAYFDDYKFQVKLTKYTDHKGEQGSDGTYGEEVLTLGNCYITNVSSINFSNESEAQIVEFSIQIKSASLEADSGFLKLKDKSEKDSKKDSKKE